MVLSCCCVQVVQVIAGGTDTPHRQDPRTMVNLFGMNPAQLAAHRGLRQLSRILSPALPLSRVLEAFEPSGRRWGTQGPAQCPVLPSSCNLCCCAMLPVLPCVETDVSPCWQPSQACVLACAKVQVQVSLCCRAHCIMLTPGAGRLDHLP